MGLDVNTLAVLFAVLLLLLGLGFTMGMDPYIGREQRKILLVIAALSFSLVIQNLWENRLFVSRSNLVLKNILSAYGYSVRPVFLILFLYIIQPKGKKWFWWVLAGVNGVLYCTSPLTKLCFEIGERDYFALRGPLWLTCPVVSAILLAWLLVQTILRYRNVRKWDHLIPLFVVLTIILSVALDYRVVLEQPVSFLTIAIVIGSVFYYVWLHLQFVRAHEQALQAEQRIQIMMQQIQPHFLYNTLSTIQALCDKDPTKASEITGKFALYLRQNIDSLGQSARIPFKKEMEHTRIYADIEKIRFPNIRLEEEIRDHAFTLPALTVQPLVENAIRHGVRIREQGIVKISTRRTDEGHEITIWDNGKGFDPEKSEEPDGTHIGITNVRERIEKMCGGSLVLESRIGEGTKVTICIPGEERSSES